MDELTRKLQRIAWEGRRKVDESKDYADCLQAMFDTINAAAAVVQSDEHIGEVINSLKKYIRRTTKQSWNN